MNQKQRVLTGAAAVTFVLLLGGCSLFPAEEELAAKPLLNEAYLPSYETIKVKRGTIDTSVYQRVSYYASAVENLAFAEDGTLSNLYVSKGDTVKKGDLLAELECTQVLDDIASYQLQLTEYQLQIKQLKEQEELQLQEMDLQLNRNLEQQKSADAQDQKQLESEFDSLLTRRTAVTEQYSERLRILEDAVTVLQLRLEDAQSMLAGRRIFAPMDGIISYITPYLPGDSLMAGKQVLRMESVGEIVFTCGEAVFEVGKIYDAETQEGTALKVIGVSDEEATLTGNLQLLTEGIYLTDRSSVIVTIPGEVRADVLYIGASALYEREDGYYVYVLNEQGLSETRNVEIGLVSGTQVEIISGLEEGEDVIV